MQLNKTIFKIENLVLVALLVLGFSVRLYRLNSPIADWHSWRQADTSAVSRNFVNSGFDLLHPRFDDLSNVASGLDNPNGYRFVEFPIYNVFQAGLYKVFGMLTLEEWGRMVTIFASLLSSVFLYLMVKKRFGNLAGVFSAFFFLFIPYNIYYSRVILPDPSMVTAILGGTYFFDRWVSREKFSILNLNFFLALIFISLSLLLKPYALFFVLPMAYFSYERFGLSLFKKWQLWVLAIIALIPLILWRTWMTQFPEGIPASSWLFNKGNIRFKPSFFYWIFADRIGRLILGYWGTALLTFAFLIKQTKNNLLFLLSFVVSSLLYVTVIAAGNVQHDYYQILIIPTISILLGVGSSSILSNLNGQQKYINVLTFLVITGFMLFFGWYYVRDYFNINNSSIIAAGEAVDKLTPKDAKVIANYNGDSSLLYQTKRKGWTSFEKGLPEMVQMGADYLILVNPTSKDLEIGKTYKIVASNSQYVIFNLRQKP